MEAHPGTTSARFNPPPPSRGGGGSRGETRQVRRSSTAPPVRFSSPPLRASPSPRVDGARRGVVQEPSPRPPASPATGVAGWAGRLGANSIPGSRPFSNTAPSWASVVRDGVRAKHTAVSRQDFLALYELCSDSGLRTRLVLRHQAGGHKISISCRLSAPPSDAKAPTDFRRRRRDVNAHQLPQPQSLRRQQHQQRHLRCHPPNMVRPPRQKPPRRRPSGLERPLGAGVRSSCCEKVTLKMNCS